MPLQKVDTPPPQSDVAPLHRGKLGRLQDPPDERDYKARSILAQRPRIPRQNARYWLGPPYHLRQNQARVSACTEEGLEHAIYGFPQPRRIPCPWSPFALYHRAQELDEWEGGERPPARQPGQPYYEGSSCRAACQAATEKWPVIENTVGGVVLNDRPVTVDLVIKMVAGPVESYFRVEEWDEALDFLACDDYDLGCSLYVGTNWSEGMFQVDPDGFLHYDPNRIAGGHAWWLNYINQKENRCGGLNSWGLTPEESGMMEGGDFYLPLNGNDGLRRMFDDGADFWVIVQPKTALAALARKALRATAA